MPRLPVFRWFDTRPPLLTVDQPKPDQPFAGWTIPLDPLLDPLRARPDFKGVLVSLAGRAR